MDRRERERILGEHAPRESTLLERRFADCLDEDLQGSPVRGRPLERRMRNFSLAADRYALSLAGPPAHSRRLREIEDEIAAHEERLAEAWVELAERRRGDAGAFAREWRACAGRWRFDAVNELIERHNLFYPAEARLPMDPRTRDFVLVGGRPYRIQPLDAEWILARFPAELPGSVAA
jgi:deoxyribodipyrimidine photolyase-like uncharacterized protein